MCNFGLGVRHKNEGKVVPHAGCPFNICIKCLQRELDKQYKEKQKPHCPKCSHEYSDQELQEIYPKLAEIIDKDRALNLFGSDIIECKFCEEKFLFQKEDVEHVAKFHNGRELTKEQIQCCADNYVLCQNCRISTCKSCGAVPYHMGETCEEYQWFVNGDVCRICGRPAKKLPKMNTALLTCDSEKCKEISDKMCKEILLCGHACVGYKCNGKHPICPICTVGGSLCPHCKKPLWGNLCLRLPCGHTIHRECALEILKRPSDGPYLQLPICPAPGCGTFVWTEAIQEEAKEDIQRWDKIMKLVNELVDARIDAEGIRYHPDVASKLNEFAWAEEDAPSNWAKKKLRFMICYNHKQPCVYTDGRIDDPPGILSCSCPMCPNYLFPVCDKCGFKWMQNKCECCCSVGVRHSSTVDQERTTKRNLLYCEICREMPKKSKNDSCKGNCKFSPHQSTNGNFYAYCVKCGNVYTKARIIVKEKPIPKK